MIIGIGVDIESVESFRKKPFLENRRFYERLFSKTEIEYCQKFRDSAQHFTARFCAKEAVIKAISSHQSTLPTDWEIQNTPEGLPQVLLRKKDAALKKFLQTHELKVSLSHTNDMAIAFAILLEGK